MNMKKKTINNVEKLVPDTSVIIEGLVSSKIEKKEIVPKSVIIHEAVLAELEHQANQNKETGVLGLEEINKIRELSEKLGFNLEFSGKRPNAYEIKYARLGEIDSLIRELAYNESASLMTSDKTQAMIAEAKGIHVIFIEIKKLFKKLKLEKFFDETTMSVHLRENVVPYAKKGTPGKWKFIAVEDTKLTRDNIKDISHEIIEESSMAKDAFIEIERAGSTIAQIGKFRIVITKPPFSDGWEITAVRPVKTLSLEDYKLSEKLKQRIENQAEGILIAGSPGMGKSTFAQALAMFYSAKEKIVKTIEAPRDLVLPDNITQYAISHGSAQEVHDVLLLSRPDYTIFDEMRNTSDFQLFADLRLSGIGLAGVVHATNPIDAIQRFVGRIELGVIPQVIDTVIFIKDGFVDKVLSLKMVVKVPTGMTEADLARPIVIVNDFETNKLEYELYSYGEETVVVPVISNHKTPANKLAEKTIKDAFRHYSEEVKVDVVSENKCVVYVPENNIAKIIGRQGKNIDEIEKKLGMSIDIKEFDKKTSGQTIEFNTEIKKKNIVFYLDMQFKDKNIGIYVNEDYLLTAKSGKTGLIKIKKNNKIARILADAINAGEKIKLML
ncbi:ATPase [Candidatus Woesearchaeota archaeon CG1_02_33_12]|nr:MAG: ATPase [Candidatus Woesearchaeota archaeon CG1_02_33_12]PIN78305.1 MAG: ATPase [Candidatus Woesearchaeota archaeon CG10_big_fil_rev_8_21_14_0_10_33_12]